MSRVTAQNEIVQLIELFLRDVVLRAVLAELAPVLS